MRQRSLVNFGAALLIGSLALTACGSRDKDPDAGSTGTGSTAKHTAVIGVVAPLTGDLTSLGIGIQNSVQLAADLANENETVPGWEFEVQAEDDTATPAVGQQAATKLASTEGIIGVVGPLNSSVAQTVAPVLNEAGITEISPSNTNPTLTMGENFVDAPARVWPTYFRTCTTDVEQGKFAAKYVYNDLGFTKVATIHDGKTYGAGLVEQFTKVFTELGGTITDATTINPADDNFSTTVTAVAATSPELVYYGGEYPQGAPLSKQMNQGGLDVPLMGGDGLYSGDYITLSGEDGSGDYATSVGAPTEQLETAAQFVSDYEAADFDKPYEAYGAYSFDAANAIINAFKAAVGDATEVDDAVRTAVVDAMADVSFAGATGDVAFDEFGDSTNKTLTVYKDAGTAWEPEKVGTSDE